MALAIVPVPRQDPVVAIKPYCGATRPIPVTDSELNDAECQVGFMDFVEVVFEKQVAHQIFRAPVPAWADLAIASHMQGTLNTEQASENVGVPHLQARFHAARCLYRFSIILLSLVENVLSYLAFFQIGSPKSSFYNKFEAHMLGFPGLDTTLLIFAVLSTCYLFMGWICVAFVKRDLYDTMAFGRLFLSLPIGGMCAAMVFFAEHTKAYPFLCSCSVLLYFLVWSFAQVKAKGEDRACKRKCYIAVMLIGIGWVVTVVVVFAVESADYLHDSSCPPTTNKAMPVRIKGVTQWQCAKWGEPHYITRVPAAGSPIYDALCSTSFHAFNTIVNASTNEQAPSNAAHHVRCPSHCQSLGLGSSVVGCQIYSATSSICSAAVQMGILQPNSGGLVTVVGRPAPSSYQRCNQQGVLSTEIAPSVTLQSPAWAFYFQLAGMQNLDMVTIHDWKKTSTPGAREPWKSYTASVTWVVGGVSRREEVQLGPNTGDIELNFCRGSMSCK